MMTKKKKVKRSDIGHAEYNLRAYEKSYLDTEWPTYSATYDFGSIFGSNQLTGTLGDYRQL